MTVRMGDSLPEVTVREIAEGRWRIGRPLTRVMWGHVARAGLYVWAVEGQSKLAFGPRHDATPPSLEDLLAPPPTAPVVVQATAAQVAFELVESPAPKSALRRPVEAGIFEGNLSELPLWALSDRHALPRIAMTDADGIERMVPNEKLLRRLVQLPSVEMRDGTVAEPSVEIIANSRFGFPTMFAARVLAIILEQARNRAGGFAGSDIVNISRWEIATRLRGKGSPIGKSVYDSIERALETLRTTSLHFRSSWHESGTEGRAMFIKATGLIAEYQFFDERKERQPVLDGIIPPETKRSYVRLSDLLVKSLRNGYYQGVDVDYLNALASPLAARLYLYLSKRDGEGRASYTEGLKKLAAKVALVDTAPSAILKLVRPALTQLATPLQVGDGAPRRFLRGFDYEPERQMLVVHFFTLAQEKAARLAGGR